MLGEKLETLITRKALLSEDIEIPISQREHYMRAFTYQKAATQYVKPFSKQDSSQISLFAKAQGFIIREPHENKIKKGTKVPVLLISENI